MLKPALQALKLCMFPDVLSLKYFYCAMQHTSEVTEADNFLPAFLSCVVIGFGLLVCCS